MKPGKATRSQLRRHNRQLILRHVFTGAATSRSALAQETDLTKPAVSDLVESLIADGLLVEEGFGASTESGGKRPRLLRFIRDARQVIGISINQSAVIGMLTNLDGEVIAEHAAVLPATDPDTAFATTVMVINGLIAQLHAPLLCIGVGISAIVDAQGVIVSAPRYSWEDFALGERLRMHFGVPVSVANSTELAALAQFTFGSVSGSLATVMISSSVGVGVVFAGGAYHLGSEVGFLADAGQTPLHDRLGWNSVLAKAQALDLLHPQRLDLTYAYIRFAAEQGNAAAIRLCDELARELAPLFAWVIALLRPDTLALAGLISDLGGSFLQQTVEYTRAHVLPALVDRTLFVIDDTPNLTALGAAARAIQLELGLL
ncbi:MAG: ROK family transcriptional regulator [Anaerolinea sp.]|nr:ROK family transcriptional regulator [Anaerolinea sp.]